MNFHVIFWLLKYLVTEGSSYNDLKYLAEAVNEVPLSDITKLGVENRAQNLLNRLMNVAADISFASSRCTARLVVQVNRHIYTLVSSLVNSSRIKIAPV